MITKEKKNRFEQSIRFVANKILSLLVHAIDIFIPDSILLFLMNLLDKRTPPKLIDFIVFDVVKNIPSRLRSLYLEISDLYVPDTAASSRKVSTVIAGIAKYIPDSLVPEDAVFNWENLKIKFHIPTLLSRGQTQPGRR